MGSKKSSSPAPQPVVSVPSPPSMSQNISEYIQNYPKLFELSKQYGPQEAQLGLDLLKQFGPQYDAYESQQQKELTPYTYDLQESLAKLAGENMNADLPGKLRETYLDQFRSEIGPNVGSGIGAGYVSDNLARASEGYRNYYQNLGLSLINRVPVGSVSPTIPQFSNPVGNYGFGDLQGYNAQNYGNYVNALISQPFIYGPQGSGKSRFNTTGALTGGAQGYAYGGPVGAGIGAVMGGFF